MNLAAIYHRSLDNWCYAKDLTTLHIRIRTGRGDVDSINLVWGDPFDWPAKQWRHHTTAMRLVGSGQLHDIWEAELAPDRQRCKYTFIIRGRDGQWQYGEQGLQCHPGAQVPADQLHRNAFSFPYLCRGDRFDSPAWVGETVWYQIFPERFRRGAESGRQPGLKAWHRGPVTNQERYGGDLRGIIDTLDHIKSLGCNGIYITPVFMAPSTHKYDTADYFTIDPAFGTNQDMKDLVAACHSRGIRIILDAVFNHSGTKFGPWLDVLEHKQASRYAEWFSIRSWEPFEFNSFAFFKGMPKLNTAHPEVKEYLLRVARFWIEECDIDGWRLDVANEVDHEFWRAFRKEVKGARPDAYIVGEVWNDAMRWLRGDQFDAVMNYRYGETISDLVARERFPTLRAWVEAMNDIDLSYPLTVLEAAFNVLDSHDTDRLITRSGGDRDRARLAWVIQFMQKGSPCVYYGSEIGLEGGQDPDNRRLMVWDSQHQDAGQLAFFRQLIGIRLRLGRLINQGQRCWVLPERQDQLGACLIGEAAPGGYARAMAFMVNRSPAPAEPQAWRSLEQELARKAGPGTWQVLMESGGPWAWKILLRA